LQGWSSGEQEMDIGIDVPGGAELAPVKASMVVQLVPLGMLVLGMGIGTTTDARIPEISRAVSLTWVARLPALTLNIDPIAGLGAQALGKFAQLVCNQFAGAVLQATQPPAKEPAALGNG
jgi:hypothetical protein